MRAHQAEADQHISPSELRLWLTRPELELHAIAWLALGKAPRLPVIGPALPIHRELKRVSPKTKGEPNVGTQWSQSELQDLASEIVFREVRDLSAAWNAVRRGDPLPKPWWTVDAHSPEQKRQRSRPVRDPCLRIIEELDTEGALPEGTGKAAQAAVIKRAEKQNLRLPTDAAGYSDTVGRALGQYRKLSQ